jgi:WD40 repeat protein
VNNRRLWYSLAILLLASTLAARAADKDSSGDPLPEGAKARLGTVGRTTGYRGFFLLAPDFDTFVFGGPGGPRLQNARTGKVTAVAGFEGAPVLDGNVVYSVSADGKRAAIPRGNTASTVDVIEVPSGKSVRTIKKPEGTGAFMFGESIVSLSADGKLAAFVAFTGAPGKKERKLEAFVWNLDKDEQVARVAVPHNQTAVPVLAPDGKTLATYGAHSPLSPFNTEEGQLSMAVHLWDATTGKALATIPNVFTSLLTRTLAFSPDGKTLATASGDSASGPIRLWDGTTGKEKDVLLCRSYQGQALAFSPDGKTLAAVARDGTIERWTLPDGAPLKPTPFPRPEHSPGVFLSQAGLAFADNERVVAWGSFGLHKVVWDAPGGKLVPALTAPANGVGLVRFSADGNEVVSVNGGTCFRWDAATGKLLGSFPFRSPDPAAPAHQLIVGATRGLRNGIVFELKTGAELFAVPGAQVASPDFSHVAGFTHSPDLKVPALIQVWNLETRKRIARCELPPNAGFSGPQTSAVAFSPDNTRLVTAVNVTNPGTPGGPLFIAGWDLKTGNKLGEFRDTAGGMVEVVAARNNSGAVLATGDGRLWVADYEKGARGDVIDESPKRGQRIAHPTFSPDGKLLAAAVPAENGLDTTVRIYNWPQGKLLHTFPGHRQANIGVLTFSPDGKTLASTATDATVLLWDLTVIDKLK